MSRFIPIAGSVLLLALAATCFSLGAQAAVPLAPPAHAVPRPADEDNEVRLEPPLRAALRQLKSRTNLGVKDMPLEKFVEFLSKRYKIRFKLDRTGLRWANIDPGLSITASFVQTPLDEGLRTILSPLGLRLRFVDGIVVITGATQPKADAEPGESPNVTAMRALRSRTQVHVERMPLADFVRRLSKDHKIPITLDRLGLRRAHLTPDAPITADIERAPLSGALRQILGPMNLAYRVVNGVVIISDLRPEPPMRIVRRRQMQPAPIMLGIAVQNQQRQAFDLLEPQLRIELLLLKRCCAPTKEQIRQVKNELEAYLRDAVVGSAAGARKSLQDRAVAAADSFLSREQADRYRSEVARRNANECRVCVLNLVASLDRELCLSAKQREALCVSLTQKWDERWSPSVELSAMQGQCYIPAVPDDLVEPHLDADQIEIWESLSKIGNASFGFQAFQKGLLEVPVADPEDD